MKLAWIFGALAVSSGGALVAGTLTVTGSMDGVAVSREGNDIMLVMPVGTVIKTKTENLPGATDEIVGNQRRLRASFSHRPVISEPESNQWVASDGNAEGKTDGAKTSDNPPAKPSPADEKKDNVLVLGEHAKAEVTRESMLATRKFSADIGVPESPAATVLGTTAKLVRLNDASDATTQVINFVDGDGNLRSGFSVAFRPYRVWVKPTLDQYAWGFHPDANDLDERGGRWVRFMSRLDFSLAATVDEAKGTNPRGASLALGLSGYVFNFADTRVALAKRLVAQYDRNLQILRGETPPTGNDGRVVSEVVTSKRTQQITDEVFNSAWNNSYWAFGGAPRWRSATGNTADFAYDGGALWTTLGYGFEGAKEKLNLDFLEDKSQLLLHTSYRDRQQVADPGDATKKIRENAWIAAAQLRIGGTNFNVFGEYLWTKHRPEGGKDYISRTYYAGVERRLASDLWLQLSVGSEKNDGKKDTSALLRTALNYAFGNSIKPRESSP